MATKRKHYTPPFKAQVALAAVKGDKTANERAGQFGAHPTLIHDGKTPRLAGAEQVFARGTKAEAGDAAAQKAERLEQIGRLKMEREGLRKKVAPLT